MYSNFLTTVHVQQFADYIALLTAHVPGACTCRSFAVGPHQAAFNAMMPVMRQDLPLMTFMLPQVGAEGTRRCAHILLRRHATQHNHPSPRSYCPEPIALAMPWAGCRWCMPCW